jgi:hypothetical protein
MQQISATKTEQRLSEAIISTLSFFALYELPLSAKRIYELLFRFKASEQEVSSELSALVASQKIIQSSGLFSTSPWNPASVTTNQLELTKKWEIIDRYFGVLASLPFVRNISVINSLALGTADSDSDIDFFVITKPNRLYFVRSLIIVLFRLLGVYKTREKMKDRFCFGFFVTTKSLEFESIMLKPSDPYFVFWLANMRPVVGGEAYWELMQKNPWLKEYFPNLDWTNRLSTTKQPNILIRAFKLIFEPIFRRIHIGHTFKLAENRSITSTTIANANMLKLHGYDVRAEVAKRFEEALKS